MTQMSFWGDLFLIFCSDQDGRIPFRYDPVCTKISGNAQKMSIVILTAIFFIVVSPASALDWTNETVDSPGDVGWYTSLALDDSGNPSIAYLDWTNRHLKYAARFEASWMNETVDTANFVGEFSSLKLNPAGQPYISYYDGNRGNLSFSMKNGAGWSTLTVDSGGVGRYTSLAIDGSGEPRICYQDLLNAKLKYAAKNGSIWNRETADNTGNVGAYSSMALDRENNPHISYYDGTNGDLKYSVKIGVNWTNQTVDSTGNVGYYTSIALDCLGNPHISYYDATNRDLKYATKAGSSWTTERVDFAGSVGKYSSIAIDDTGITSISYYDETNGHLKYAVKNGFAWTNCTVDNAANTGMYTSLALDRSGNPHISYRDFGSNDLRYARGLPPLLLNFTASSRNGPAPLTIQFSDTSSGGSPSLWNWSFGDGTGFNTSVAALRNPSHIYETSGIYTVNLTVQNFSTVSTLSRSGYITVITLPETTMPTLSPTPTFTSTPTPVLTTSPLPTVTSPPTPTITSSPTPTITSFPTPALNSTVVPTGSPIEDTGSGDDLSNGSLSPFVPRTAGSFSCQTVNVGGNSAIRRVTITGLDIADIIVTAKILPSLASGIPPIDIPVYQYIEISPARYSVISAALIEFDVPLSIADSPGSTMNVSLCMLENRTWICLPAWRSGSQNGNAFYHAESPEFSLFAITIRNETSRPQTIHKPDAIPVSEKINVLGFRESNSSINPEIPIKIAPVESNTGLSFTPLVISIIGIVGIGTVIGLGIILIRSRGKG
jgi:PGF-pre-PGF domain-containing protein